MRVSTRACGDGAGLSWGAAGLKPALLASAALLSLAAPALAQEGASTESEVGEVVVTGSRIVADGFQQPTPVTVVGQQEIQRQMPVTIANYLNDLPSFGGSNSARNPGIGVAGGGAENVNLRSLGTNRTLVLLDNRRVVASGIGGAVDTLTLPSSLVQRVEVVTGGASAAWGADAVAGVVNFVLNHNYEGFGFSAQAGISERGDNENGSVDFTFGRKFADGRIRFIADVNLSYTPDGVKIRDRSWWRNRAVLVNPTATATNGQVQRITVDWAATANIAPGGVITGGPLRGIQFVGPTGTPVPYDFGITSGILKYGGDLDLSISRETALTSALKYGNAFTHVDFDLTDDITAYAEFSYGKSIYEDDGYLFYTRVGNLVIQADNAFLDPSIRQQLVTRAQPNFTMGLTFIGGDPPNARNEREVWRGVVGVDGRYGENWKWGAYFQHGEADARVTTTNNPLVPRFNLAVDAVRDPATGAIVCRSTLTDRTNGCVPLNVFGNNVASAEALRYVQGTLAWQKTSVELDVFSFNASGTVFHLPAGDVSVAFGAEYAKDKAVSTQDPFSAARQFATGNFQPFRGSRNVKEGFAEAAVPLLKDLPMVKSLELNGAARITDYSTSGSVTTWKIGGSYEVNDDLRFRVTRSRDIRAPSLSDLFNQGTSGTQFVFDPFTNRSYQLFAITRGNPNLKPEEADTWTAGAIYRPSFVPGLQMSVDYYRIEINGAISTVGAPQTVQRCFNGETALCPFIIRDATGTITSVSSAPVNINKQLTRGFDFEIDYRREVGPGELTLRGLATYVPVLNTIDNGVTRKLAGAVGGLNGSQPYWKGIVTGTYEQGPLSYTLRARLIGKSVLDRLWKSGVDVDDNSVPAYVNFDLTTVYKFKAMGADAQLTFAVLNIFDRDPVIVPVVPGTVPYVNPGFSNRLDLYDALGRSYRVGLRAKF
jgi:outer membrane receptor protein involved in Fe transport